MTVRGEGLRLKRARKADTDGGDISNEIQGMMLEKGRKCSMREKFRNGKMRRRLRER